MTDMLLPDLENPLEAPFWAAVRQSRLQVQRCERCSYLRWTPATVCPECLAVGGEWVDVAGSGTLWSFAVYHRALHPAFKKDVPYTVGLVELDCGVRMIGRLVGAPEEFVIGQQLEAVFEAVTPEVTMVRWRPVAA